MLLKKAIYRLEKPEEPDKSFIGESRKWMEWPESDLARLTSDIIKINEELRYITADYTNNIAKLPE